MDASALRSLMAQPTMTREPATKGCFSFESYQRARFLCQEFVREKPGTGDPLAQLRDSGSARTVVAFYARQHGKPDATIKAV